jgi:hypothetical protein
VPAAFLQMLWHTVTSTNNLPSEETAEKAAGGAAAWVQVFTWVLTAVEDAIASLSTTLESDVVTLAKTVEELHGRTTDGWNEQTRRQVGEGQATLFETSIVLKIRIRCGLFFFFPRVVCSRPLLDPAFVDACINVRKTLFDTFDHLLGVISERCRVSWVARSLELRHTFDAPFTAHIRYKSILNALLVRLRRMVDDDVRVHGGVVPSVATGIAERRRHRTHPVEAAPSGLFEVRCAFSDRNLHSRMPLVLTPARSKLLPACDQ